MTENGNSSVTEAVQDLLGSQTHVQALKESWGYLESDKKAYGIELFIRLFREVPAAKDLFEQFKNIQTEDLRGHRKLKGHATTFMYGLKSFFDNVDDVELFEEMIRKTARNHVKRGILSDKFQLLGPVVLGLLEDIMKEKYTKLTTESWVKLLDVIVMIVDDETRISE